MKFSYAALTPSRQDVIGTSENSARRFPVRLNRYSQIDGRELQLGQQATKQICSITQTQNSIRTKCIAQWVIGWSVTTLLPYCPNLSMQGLEVQILKKAELRSDYRFVSDSCKLRLTHGADLYSIPR